MKAASATIIVHKLAPGDVAAGGMITGALLLFLVASGMLGRLSRVTPPGVVSGIQVGLGLSLAVMGVELIRTEPLLGWPILAGMLFLLTSRYFPAAIIALVAGTGINLLLHPGMPLPNISLGMDFSGFI